jgi:hypothetical protein
MIPLLELVVSQLVKNVTAFYGNRRYSSSLIHVLKKISIVHGLPSCYFNMYVYFSIIAHLSIGIFHFDISTKIFYVFLISPLCATCPDYLILLLSHKRSIYKEALSFWKHHSRDVDGFTLFKQPWIRKSNFWYDACMYVCMDGWCASS